MAITTYPLNNITYDAEDAELFHCTRRSGVFMGSSGDTEYTDFDATVTGSNRIVTIQPGLAWIRNGRFKGKVVCVDASVSLTLNASNATYPRYDAIVLRFNPSTNSSQLISVQGGASSNPARPTPVRVENGTYDLHLYHVYRPAGSSVITSANVEDMRADLNYCGYMVDDVSAFDESKFLAKQAYDPSDSVARAGGIAQYVQTNAPKVTVSTSVTSTSTTTAASSSAVKKAYDLANQLHTKKTTEGSIRFGSSVVGSWEFYAGGGMNYGVIEAELSASNPCYLTLSTMPGKYNVFFTAFLETENSVEIGVCHKTSDTNATLYFPNLDEISGSIYAIAQMLP